MPKKYERIRNLREDKDISQTIIANYLNVNQKTYSRYETGEHSIPIETLIKLAGFHSTSIDYLVGLTNTKEPYPRN